MEKVLLKGNQNRRSGARWRSRSVDDCIELPYQLRRTREDGRLLDPESCKKNGA